MTLVTLVSHVAGLLYFMAPAYAANMAPPFVRYWKGWNRPLSRRWLGDHNYLGYRLGIRDVKW